MINRSNWCTFPNNFVVCLFFILNPLPPLPPKNHHRFYRYKSYSNALDITCYMLKINYFNIRQRSSFPVPSTYRNTVAISHQICYNEAWIRGAHHNNKGRPRLMSDCLEGHASPTHWTDTTAPLHVIATTYRVSPISPFLWGYWRSVGMWYAVKNSKKNSDFKGFFCVYGLFCVTVFS